MHAHQWRKWGNTNLCTYFHSSKCFQLGYSHSQSILSFCQVYSFRHNYRWQFFLIFYIQRFKLLKQIILWSQEGNLKPLTTNPYLKVHKAFSKKNPPKSLKNPTKSPKLSSILFSQRLYKADLEATFSYAVSIKKTSLSQNKDNRYLHYFSHKIFSFCSWTECDRVIFSTQRTKKGTNSFFCICVYTASLECLLNFSYPLSTP